MHRIKKTIINYLTSFCILTSVIFCSCRKQEQATYKFAPDNSKKLTLYSSLDSDETTILAQEFEKVTGIWVKVYANTAPQVLEQILEEDSADVLLCCATDAISVFDEQISPYVKNNSLVPRPFGKKNLAAFAITRTGFLYNNLYFEPMNDEQLLNSIKTSRKLAMLDPYISAENYTCLFYLLNTTPISLINDFSTTYTNAAFACESIAEGFCSAVIVPENIALRFKSTHSSIRTAFILPPDSAYIIETAAMLKTCKNKDNAERFIAFLQNIGTQSFLSQNLKYHPIRRDLEISEEEKEIISHALSNIENTESQIKNKAEFIQQWLKKTTGSEK